MKIPYFVTQWVYWKDKVAFNENHGTGTGCGVVVIDALTAQAAYSVAPERKNPFRPFITTEDGEHLVISLASKGLHMFATEKLLVFSENK